MKIKRVMSAVLSAAMMISLCSCGNSPKDNIGENMLEEGAKVYEFTDAFTTVSDMKCGWNLGNSLDCAGNYAKLCPPEDVEKSWGNPVTTRELIQAVKDGGFNTVRVPVTWKSHFDPDDYTLYENWLNRVTEVVDYVIDADMYCIINVHHDTGGDGWLRASTESWENYSKQYEAIWRQIAEHFKDYDNRLLFEGFNEILDEHSSWNTTDEESYTALNNFNQLFVDTVRATGGNNSERNLIVCTYACNCQEPNLQNFTIPTDTAENHIIMENHIYDPGWFTSKGGTVPERDWGTDDDKAEIDALFERINKYAGGASGWNVPVIIGEFGAQDMSGNEENRAVYTKYFVEAAKKYGITCIYWDDGGSMGIIDRTTYEWTCPKVKDAIVNAG